MIVSEYNPAIEQEKTGLTIVEIFEQLMTGWIDCAKEIKKRKHNEEMFAKGLRKHNKGVKFSWIKPKDFIIFKWLFGYGN